LVAGDDPTPVIVISPTYNEVGNVDALVDGVLAHPPRYRLVVVDDRSPDGTGERVERRAASEGRVSLLSRPRRQGYGRAVAHGLMYAVELGAAVVVQMDADGSHDPAVLPALVAAVEEGGADVAIGSRYVPGGAIEGWARRRRVLSRGANGYVRTVLSMPAHDCTAGFRAYRAPWLRRCDPREVRAGDYAFLIEYLHRLGREGARVAEVPITFTERRSGRSNLSVRAVVESVVNPWRIRFGAGR
jgi:dolichol-phosphate mannosyltransferase